MLFPILSVTVLLVGLVRPCHVSFSCVDSPMYMGNANHTMETISSAFGNPNLTATIPLSLPRRFDLLGRLDPTVRFAYFNFVIRVKGMILLRPDQVSSRLQRLRELEYEAVDLFERIPRDLAHLAVSQIFNGKCVHIDCQCGMTPDMQTPLALSSMIGAEKFVYFSPLKLFYEMTWRSVNSPFGLVDVQHGGLEGANNDYNFGDYLNLLPAEIMFMILGFSFQKNANYTRLTELSKSFRSLNPTHIAFSMATPMDIAGYIQKNLSTAYDHPHRCPLLYYALARSGVFAFIPDTKYNQVVSVLARSLRCGVTPVLVAYNPLDPHTLSLLHHFLSDSSESLLLCLQNAVSVMPSAICWEPVKFLGLLNTIFASNLLWRSIDDKNVMIRAAACKIIIQALAMRALRPQVATALFTVPFDSSYAAMRPLFKHHL